MFHKIELLLTAILLTISNLAFADDLNDIPCREVEKQNATIYYNKTLNSQDDPGMLFKTAIENMNKLAEQYHWQNYKILSKDISLDYSYGRNVSASITLNLELDSSYPAITQLFQHADADSLSFYFQNVEDCNNTDSQ